MELEKQFVIHLTECTGRHKALELLVTGMDSKIQGHIISTEQFRTASAKGISTLKVALVAGFALVLLSNAMGTAEAMRLVLGLLK